MHNYKKLTAFIAILLFSMQLLPEANQSLFDAVTTEDTKTLKLFVKTNEYDDNKELYDQTIHFATETGSIKALEILLTNKDIDVNSCDQHGETILHKAIRLSHYDTPDDHAMIKDYSHHALIPKEKMQFLLVNLLIKHNIDINIVNNYGQSALHLAVREGNFNIIQLLIQNDANINIADKYGNTPLHVAVCNNYKNIIILLIENGGDIVLKNNRNKTPLRLSVVQKNVLSTMHLFINQCKRTIL